MLQIYMALNITKINDYYDVSLKEERLRLAKNDRYIFVKGDLADKALVNQLFDEYKRLDQ